MVAKREMSKIIALVAGFLGLAVAGSLCADQTEEAVAKHILSATGIKAAWWCTWNVMMGASRPLCAPPAATECTARPRRRGCGERAPLPSC